MPHAILELRRLDDRILVIYDYTEFPAWQQAHNLVAYDRVGNELWTAQHATAETADCYVTFLSTAPLWVWSFAGLRCNLDPMSGKLIAKVLGK